MSNQEVWITLRIKSELPVEEDAPTFARKFAARMDMMRPFKPDQLSFLDAASPVEVIEVKEERHIYGLE